MDPSYNDSFGSFGNNSDVVFQGTEQKNSKKKIIIIGAIVVLVIVAVVVVLIMNMGKNDNTPSLSKYLNLVVNGDENNNADVGNEYSRDKVYYLRATLYDDDFGARITYFDKLSGLLDKIEKQNKDEDKYPSISIQKEMLKTYKFYSETNGLDIDADLALYASGGREALNERYLNNLASIDSLVSGYTSFFNKDIKDYYNSLMDLIMSGEKNNCDMSSFEKMTECDAMFNDDEAIKNLHNVSKESEQIGQLVRGSAVDFIELALTLVEENGETK